MTPKLKTSVFSEITPSIAYSGDMYPLSSKKNELRGHEFYRVMGKKISSKTCLLSSDRIVCPSLSFVPCKDSGHPKIRDLWDHIFIKQNVTWFQIPVDYPKP